MTLAAVQTTSLTPEGLVGLVKPKPRRGRPPKPKLPHRALIPVEGGGIVVGEQLSFCFDVLPDAQVFVPASRNLLVDEPVVSLPLLDADVAQASASTPESGEGSACKTKPYMVTVRTASSRPKAPVAKRGRRRVHVEPAPLDPNGPPVSVYQRLEDYGLLRKLTDISLAEAGVPVNLRSDAKQEIHAVWLGLTVKPEYARNQLANYAYLSGTHAALKLRRTLGGVVTIPGVLFRTGVKSSLMESIGAVTNPHDIDEFANYKGLSFDNTEVEESYISEDFLAKRLGQLDLTAQQYQVAHAILVLRQSAFDVADVLGIEPGVVERMVEQITNKLRKFDESNPKEDSEMNEDENNPSKPLVEGTVVRKIKCPLKGKTTMRPYSGRGRKKRVVAPESQAVTEPNAKE